VYVIVGVPVTSSIEQTIERASDGTNVDDSEQERGRKRRALKRAINQVFYVFSSIVRPTFDLAAGYATAGFSGADIVGLVRCAGSLALARAKKDGNGVYGLLITLDDVK
jgi:hypothetical protein